MKRHVLRTRLAYCILGRHLAFLFYSPLVHLSHYHHVNLICDYVA